MITKKSLLEAWNKVKFAALDKTICAADILHLLQAIPDDEPEASGFIVDDGTRSNKVEQKMSDEEMEIEVLKFERREALKRVTLLEGIIRDMAEVIGK